MGLRGFHLKGLSSPWVSSRGIHPTVHPTGLSSQGFSFKDDSSQGVLFQVDFLNLELNIAVYDAILVNSFLPTHKSIEKRVPPLMSKTNRMIFAFYIASSHNYTTVCVEQFEHCLQILTAFVDNDKLYVFVVERTLFLVIDIVFLMYFSIVNLCR